jgi:hypothetical protein
LFISNAFFNANSFAISTFQNYYSLSGCQLKRDLFSLIADLSKGLDEIKNRVFPSCDKKPGWVGPLGLEPRTT